MGNIIQLNDRQSQDRPFQRSSADASLAAQCRTARILFFTGVRYEYLAPEEFAPEEFGSCAKKASKAQSVRLQAGKCVFGIPQLQ